ncbi:hypothetical protein [Phenylobacterium sp.]|uniref:hypothetical protein n=1 Tax=Phenylobacterium sp. TaxID=1871053 RepID=UPI003002CCDF
MKGPTAKKDPHEGCPLRAVDRRLEDVHRQWHAAEEVYFDPEGFRVAIQTAIQTLRTVTFILQSNKRLIPNFDEWYAPWQEKLKADPLMRWMVDARNKIEKQGDLEAHSTIRAQIIASYLEEGPSIGLAAKLADGPEALLKKVPVLLAQHIRQHGVLRVERRWFENSLPEHELLDAVAIAYGRVAEVLADAHRQLHLTPPTTTDVVTGQAYGDGLRQGRLPCMIGHADARAIETKLLTGQRTGIETVTKGVDVKVAGKVLGRYGTTAAQVLGPGETADDRLNGLFATAQKMFLKDGYHITAMFLLNGGKPVRTSELRADTQSDKYLIMRMVAHEAVKFSADAAILISEAWSAKADPAHPYRRAADAPDREEFLVATLVSKDGEPQQLSAKIEREGQSVKLGPVQTSNDGAYFQFAPLYAAWGKPIPEAWKNMSPVAMSEKD